MSKKLFWIEGMDICRMDTGAGPSFPERLGVDNSISKLILSNNLSYNLHSFMWESVHSGKRF